MCWALLLQGHMLCKGGIAGILLRKTKEENPLLLQRQSHFAPQNKEGNPLLLHGQSHFAPQNKEENPLLLHGQSHFAPQNKED